VSGNSRHTDIRVMWFNIFSKFHFWNRGYRQLIQGSSSAEATYFSSRAKEYATNRWGGTHTQFININIQLVFEQIAYKIVKNMKSLQLQDPKESTCKRKTVINKLRSVNCCHQ